MDKLQFIVQSFSNEEKSGFEHFINRFRVRDNRKDFQLFERLTELNSLSLNEALEFLYDGAEEKEAYHALRKRLLGHLIEYITLKGINETKGNAHYNSEGLISLSQYLFEKGAFQAGWQYLKRALASEIKKGDQDILAKLYLLWLEHWEEYSGIEKFNDIYKLYVDAKEKSERDQRFKLALSIVKRKIEQFKLQLKEINIDKIIKDVVSGMDLNKKEFNSLENLYYVAQLIRASSLVSKDYIEVEKYLNTRLKKLEKKEGDAVHTGIFWELKYFQAHACYRLKKIDKAKEILFSINLSQGNITKNKHDELFCKIELLNWACEFYANNVDAGIHRLLLLENNEIFKNNSIYDLDRKMNLITSLFAKESYKRANSVLKSIGHSSQWLQKKKGLEWRVKFQIIELIVLYENDKIDLVMLRLRAINRLIREVVKINPNYKNLSVFLKIIKISVDQGSFIGLDNELDKFQFSPFKQENIQAMAFYAYIKSKIKKENYYNTLMELIERE